MKKNHTMSLGRSDYRHVGICQRGKMVHGPRRLSR